MVVFATAVGSILIGCGSSDTTARHPDGELRISVVGSAPAGVRVTYIPSHGGLSAPQQVVLTNKARLPYTAVQNVDPTQTHYSLNVSLLGPGHITCSLQIGSASEAGQAATVGSLCRASLQWSARLRHWVVG